jgi:hypothetical protein
MSFFLDCLYFYIGVMPLIGGICSILFTTTSKDIKKESRKELIFNRLFIETSINEKIYLIISFILFSIWFYNLIKT